MGRVESCKKRLFHIRRQRDALIPFRERMRAGFCVSISPLLSQRCCRCLLIWWAASFHSKPFLNYQRRSLERKYRGVPIYLRFCFILELFPPFSSVCRSSATVELVKPVTASPFSFRFLADLNFLDISNNPPFSDSLVFTSVGFVNIGCVRQCEPSQVSPNPHKFV